jgi:hypothetical protein
MTAARRPVGDLPTRRAGVPGSRLLGGHRHGPRWHGHARRFDRGQGASTTAAAFTLTGGGVGGKATVTCSVTVNGVTYTVAVTAN